MPIKQEAFCLPAHDSKMLILALAKYLLALAAALVFCCPQMPVMVIYSTKYTPPYIITNLLWWLIDEEKAL